MSTTAEIRGSMPTIGLGPQPWLQLVAGEPLYASFPEAEYTVALARVADRAVREANLRPEGRPGYLLLLDDAQVTALSDGDAQYGGEVDAVLRNATGVLGATVRVARTPAIALRTICGDVEACTVTAGVLAAGSYVALGERDGHGDWRVGRVTADYNPRTGSVSYVPLDGFEPQERLLTRGPNLLVPVLLGAPARLGGVR